MQNRMNPEILFEDDDVLVLNKPAGLIVHSDGRTEEATLVDWLIEKYPSIKDVGDPSGTSEADGDRQKGILRSGIVHRLDRETSGAIVVAKTQEAFLYLKRQFQNREVHKKYHLFVRGEVKQERGIIDRPIGKSPNDFRRWSAQRGAKGELREAVTWYRVLARKDGFSFVEAQPRTGRTHQIRVHFKAINYPVVCDKLYASKNACALGFSRTALHSFSISFKGRGGKEISVTAPYPEDFRDAQSALGLPSIP